MNITKLSLLISLSALLTVNVAGQVMYVAEGGAMIMDGGKVVMKEGISGNEHKMTLKQNATLLITPGATITTPSYAKVVVQSGADYINLGSSNPLLEVQRTITGQKGWRMVAAPAHTTYSDMFSGFVTQGFTGSTYPAKQPNLMWYDETDLGTSLQSWRMPDNLSQQMTTGRGCFHYVFNGAGITGGGTYPDVLPITMGAEGYEELFTGSTFSFGVTFTPQSSPGSSGIYTESTEEGWNLLGNPTASTLDWDNGAAWSRQNMDQAIYIWDPAANSGAGEYKFRSGGLGTLPNGKIAPFQAFWVHASNTSPVLTVSNTAKTTQGIFYRLGRDGEAVDIPLVLKSGTLSATAFLTFSDNGNPGSDPGDAYRLEPLSDTWLELFTLGSATHHQPLVINHQPALGEFAYHLPMYVGGQMEGKELSGSCHLSWEVPSAWPADWTISLHDHLTETAVNMVTHSSYDFNLPVVSGARLAPGSEEFIALAQVVKPIAAGSACKIAHELPRFSIIINRGSSDQPVSYIGLTPALLPNYPNPFHTGTTIRFSLPVEDQVALSLFDLQFRKVAEITTAHFDAGIHEVTFNCDGLVSGVYLLQLSTSDHRDIIKINKI
jgi:hypothetical protein